MESEDLLPVLFDSYKKEKTLFVRPDYLKAIAGMDCEAFLDEMEEQLEMLRAKEPLAERVRRRTFCMIIDHEKTRFKLQPRRTGSISSFTPKSSKTRF